MDRSFYGQRMASRPSGPKPPVSARSDAFSRRTRQLERTLDRLTARDGSEAVMRRRAEHVLAQVGDVAVAVLIANDRARFVDVNKAASDLTGYSRGELLRMSVWDLTPTPQRKRGLQLCRRFLDRGRMRGRYQIRRKDGTVVISRYFAVARVLPGTHVSALTHINE